MKTMKDTLQRPWLPLLAVLLCGSLAPAGEWVSKDGQTTKIEGRHAALVISEGGEPFDLSQLSDGEARTFGQGQKQVTARREGSTVVIERSRAGEAQPLEIKCDVGRDRCKIVTFDDDAEKVAIVIEKTRECVNGVGDCDGTVDIALQTLPAGAQAIVRAIHCDDAGNCKESVETQELTDADAGSSVVIVRAGDAAIGDRVALHCPEGDATLMVAKDEAQETFLCPKHSVPLEPGANKTVVHKVRVKKE